MLYGSILYSNTSLGRQTLGEDLDFGDFPFLMYTYSFIELLKQVLTPPPSAPEDMTLELLSMCITW